MATSIHSTLVRHVSYSSESVLKLAAQWSPQRLPLLKQPALQIQSDYSKSPMATGCHYDDLTIAGPLNDLTNSHGQASSVDVNP